MRAPRKAILDRVETDYIRGQIDTGNNTRIKSALQSLCKYYRLGMTVSPDQLTGVVNAVVGTAYQPTIDDKVRRWVLNTLARLAKEGNGIHAVLHLLKQHPNEPQTVASGIAAVYKLCARQKPDDVLKGISFDPQMRTLAALQHIPAEKLDLSDLPIDVSSASSDVLQLALVVIGLARSPENLLNPRHSDGEMVRALGKHHDPIVSQYTIWAITENDNLGVAHLGVDINNIEEYPENIRAWILQLLAIEANVNQPHWEILRFGMEDPAAEARRGLAMGLRSTFVDILEPLVLDWITSEPDADVRQHLLSHIVQHAHRSRHYEQYAIEIFDGEPAGSMLRQSMEASAVKLPIYTKFKQIGAGALDLFGARSITVVEKQYNIGSVQGGAVNVGDGNATNYGATSIQVLSTQQIEAAQTELAKLEAALHTSSLDSEKKAKALQHVQAAKADPSPGKIGQVIEYLGYLGTLVEVGNTLQPYLEGLLKAVGG